MSSTPPRPSSPPTVPIPPAARYVGAVVGFVFAGIGLTVIIFLWSAPFDEFGSPPLFFRIFGSLIAVAFVAIGGGAALASLRGRAAIPPAAQAFGGRALGSPAPQVPAGGVPHYQCPHCGAPLGQNADVSPSGDVKCAFCGRWFNIHRGA